MLSEPSNKLCGVCGHSSHHEDGCDLIALKATRLVKDSVIPTKAQLSLPSCLALSKASQNTDEDAASNMLGLHRGEWVEAKENLLRGTWFGPLDTSKTRRLRGNPRIKLANIQNRSRLPLWYDTFDPTVCNWMMLVPICKKNQIPSDGLTSSVSATNLLVVEYDGKIYFVASREIRKGERLEAAYSPSYKTSIDKIIAAEKKRVWSKISHSASIKRRKIRSSNENETSSEVAPYICASCAVCFDRESKFQKHIQDAHRNTCDFGLNTVVDKHLILCDSGATGLQVVENVTVQSVNQNLLHETEQPTSPQKLIVDLHSIGAETSGQNKGKANLARSLDIDSSRGQAVIVRGSMGVVDSTACETRPEISEDALEYEQEAVDTLATIDSATSGGRIELEVVERFTNLSSTGSTSTSSVMRSGAACHICLKWLSSSATLRSHVRACQMSRNGDIPDLGACRYCGLVLTSLPEYRRHVLSHLLEHECPLCRARFRLASLVVSHACPCLRASRELSIEHHCDVCEIDIGNLISTEVHLRLGCQGYRRPYKCERCEQSFYLQSSLQYHLCLVKGEEGLREIDLETTAPGFVCETCGAFLSSTSSLNKHRLRHTNPAFNCAECGKSFHRQDGLEGHKATHQRHRERQQQQQQQQSLPLPDVKVLSNEAAEGKDVSGTAVLSYPSAERVTTNSTHCCYICGKGLSSRSSLRVHLRSHSTNYRFRCPHCEKGYNQKINLEKHLISSHQSVKFWCGECKRSFTSKESLELHSLDHQGAPREHRCSLCPAAFHRVYQLRKHQRHLHNGRIFSCPLCTSTMKLAGSLLRHLRTIHPDRPDVAATQAKEVANLDRRLP
ncbi:zinc finger protein 502-like [Varroa jacobsoni]|uniref:zinc finger protein 502-like n=1 Tax=Varroa jacobsoni TaxID=62625 RepID=UPI000BFA10BB|nr:zinc finger protein 502-like [Varroa jacobsoni]